MQNNITAVTAAPMGGGGVWPPYNPPPKPQEPVVGLTKGGHQLKPDQAQKVFDAFYFNHAEHQVTPWQKAVYIDPTAVKGGFTSLEAAYKAAQGLTVDGKQGLAVTQASGGVYSLHELYGKDNSYTDRVPWEQKSELNQFMHSLFSNPPEEFAVGLGEKHGFEQFGLKDTELIGLVDEDKALKIVPDNHGWGHFESWKLT